MYRQVDTDANITFENGSDAKPVATLADEYGGRCQVVFDDGCYVLALKHTNGAYYQFTDHIFAEAFEVLKTLPTPTKQASWAHHGLDSEPEVRA